MSPQSSENGAQAFPVDNKYATQATDASKQISNCAGSFQTRSTRLKNRLQILHGETLLNICRMYFHRARNGDHKPTADTENATQANDA